MKGRLKMKPSPEFASPSMPAIYEVAANHVYQGLTIAAMIVLLGTLWAF
jgi:hypothetical protein